ncbi:MAG: hypothetical protein Fues2KO_08620 [Fuerstiella sp.]
MATAAEKFKRLRTRLSGQPEDIQQSYEKTCQCGEVLSGMRRTSWIQVECPQCYEAHFLLPVNVYPSTESVPSEVLGGSFRERLAVVVQELLPSRDKAADESSTSETSPKKKRSAGDGDSATAQPEDARRSLRERLRGLVPRIDLRQLAARTFTPFRMLMLAIIGVVGLTIYWSGYQQRVDEARQTWLSTEEEIAQYVAGSDFTNLQLVLRQAVDAGRVLNLDDADWRQRLNLLDETESVLAMSGDSLLTAFHVAYEDGQLSADAAQQVTATATSGVFLFDTYLSASADAVPTLEFPATPGQHSVRLFAPFAALEKLAIGAPEGRIVCAARIAEVLAPTESNPSWQVLLDADHFVLMTSLRHCEAVGLSPDDDPGLQVVLDWQREFVVDSDTWDDRSTDSLLPRAFRKESAQ